MAEGILRQAAGDLFDVQSAGSRPSGYVHPMAIDVMGEIGIDLSGHRSKSLDEFIDQDVEIVITVCDNAAEICPVFPGQSRRYHWSYPDPAKAEGDTDAVRAVFRQVRDAIRARFESYAAGYRDGISGVTKAKGAAK